MVLSETDAEAQLAALRRQRETLDRSIADLTLYLELGRRLRTMPGDASATDPAQAAPSPEAKTRPLPATGSIGPSEDFGSPPHRPLADYDPSNEPGLPATPQGFSSLTSPVPDAHHSTPSQKAAKTSVSPETMVGAADYETGPIDGVLSEGVLARRYGRALIEAALAALEEAGRPLHAGEILAVLTSRGFALPGHDPVAALNTRLWKRSGPGGPIKRMGDAVYALVEPADGHES